MRWLILLDVGGKLEYNFISALCWQPVQRQSSDGSWCWQGISADDCIAIGSSGSFSRFAAEQHEAHDAIAQL